MGYWVPTCNYKRLTFYVYEANNAKNATAMLLAVLLTMEELQTQRKMNSSKQTRDNRNESKTVRVTKAKSNQRATYGNGQKRGYSQTLTNTRTICCSCWIMRTMSLRTEYSPKWAWILRLIWGGGRGGLHPLKLLVSRSEMSVKFIVLGSYV